MDKLEILKEYVDAKAVIKEAEERVKVLSMQIKAFTEVDDVFDIGEATVSCVKGRASYKYSPELTEKERALKEAQKIEVQSGIAVAEHGEPYLVVKFK